MKKRFRVWVKLPLVLTFEDERATDKTAAFVASRVLYIFRDFFRPGLDGKCHACSEEEHMEVLSVESMRLDE